MKILILTVMILFGIVVSSYAVDISMVSTIQIANAPVNSSWRVECGTSSGVYTSLRQVSITPGINNIPVYTIFPIAGSFFCRTAFVQIFGMGPFSNEVSVNIIAPTLVAPSLSIIP